MCRLLLTICFLLGAAGCTALPEWAMRLSPKFSDHVDTTGHYDFAWRLSGDRPVAPLQVFDNGRQTWLQFAPGQAIPAIFSQSAKGERPVEYKLAGHYVVLDGVWPALVLRGGRLKSYVKRILPDIVDPKEPNTTVEASVVDAATHAQAQETPISEPVTSKANFPGLGLPALSVQQVHEDQSVTAQTVAEALPQVVPYHVGPEDQNLRLALSRWASSAGWTFQAEHWDVDADIPLIGSATFPTDFKTAVQELVATTELADRPLQPCFYSNQVLRVVPYAQSCNRMGSLPEAS